MKAYSLPKTFVGLVFAAVLALAACTPTTLDDDSAPPQVSAEIPEEPGPAEFSGELEGAQEVEHFYVAPDGFDTDGSGPGTTSNAWRCQNIDSPCRTVAYAQIMAHQTPSGVPVPEVNHIHLAPGVYDGLSFASGGESARGGTLIISGAGVGNTIIETSGFHISGEGEVRVEDLTISGTVSCISTVSSNSEGEVISFADVVLENIECIGNGVAHRGAGLMTLNSVTIHGRGDGLQNEGEMIVNDSDLFENTYGLINEGNLQINHSFIYDNVNHGVVARSGLLQMDRVMIYNNSGAGVQAGPIGSSPRIEIQTSRIYDNEAGITLFGEADLLLQNSIVSDHLEYGLSVEGESSAVVEMSTFENNQIDEVRSAQSDISVIRNHHELSLFRVLVDGNLGTAVFTYTEGHTEIIESEISNNTVTQGLVPIVVNHSSEAMSILRSSIHHNQVLENVPVVGGLVRINNSTISSNTGSGLGLAPGSSLVFSTIAENSEQGVAISSSGNYRIRNAIIAGNVNDDCWIINGDWNPRGFNIDSDGTCNLEATYSLAELMLQPLSDSGGSTMVHPLLAESPAVDAAEGACPATDQRIMARPQGASCDVGAYEEGGLTAATQLGASGLPAVVEIEGEAPAGGLIAIPDRNYNCRYGNSSVFDIADTLYQGEEYQPVGQGSDGLWLQFRGPAFDQLCWAPTQGFTLYLDGDEVELPNLPLDLLGVKAYPATPTPTEDPDESYDVTPTPTPADTKTPKPSATPTCDPQQQQCP